MTTVQSQYLPIQVTATTAAVQNGWVNLAKVYWYQPTTTAQTVVLQDQNGNLVWEGYCEVANQSQVFEFPRPISVSGWQVPTLAGGTLIIYTA